MKMFITAAALVSWCGLKPRNEESAGKSKSRRITHGNKYIRKTMIEAHGERAAHRIVSIPNSVTYRRWFEERTR